MATDSTELTFVRCPSCRSLVPAVSTRCRMCGAGLDSLEKEETSPAELQKSGRVRQRTMSQSGDALSRAASELREDLKSEPDLLEPKEMDFGSGSNGQHEADDAGFDDDPLGAYVEEVTEAPLKSKPEPEAEVPRPAPMSTRSSWVEPPTTPVASQDKSDDDWLSDVDEDLEELDDEPAPVARFKKRRRGKTKSEAPMVEAPVAAVAPKPSPVIQVAAPIVEQPKSSGDGQLVGWLVNFTDPKGRAIELREGKFFVTRKSFKSNDLVLDDASISVPHCLMRVQSGGVLEVQDMMSETGLAVKRQAKGDFVTEEKAKLAHGDWVKIGTLEYLVSLVPVKN